MLKRGTLGLLLAAIALTGGVLLLENRSGENRSGSNVSQNTANSDSEANEKLLAIEEEDVEKFSVLRQGINESTVDDSTDETSEDETAESGQETEMLVFEKKEDGTWQMTQPEEMIAESGAIAFLLNQITSPTARSVTLNDSEADLAEFGLAKPDYTVSLTANGKDYTLKVGGLDFAGDNRYVQAIAGKNETSEPESEKSEEEKISENNSTLGIYVVPGSILNAVKRPLSEWLIADDTEIKNDDETKANASEKDPEESVTEAADETDASDEPEASAPEETTEP